ncbi:MAG TPA: sigma-54 dependent transcriptional regulator [Ignavibacteria bacterium]|nr:sigma-54 dependent transcriptional regulator [Ignavibacteria bacterium]HMR40252.1 sigma-54 dependent transcriptional regulator [Ignavibacteria bacterium]
MENILVVDDNEILRFTLKELLVESGFKCNAVEDGTKALQQVKTDQYDLVILDMRLPGMNGLEILNRIKKTNNTLPVIMLTAFGDIKTAVEAMKLGADDFITKPFDNDLMILTLRKTLENKYLKDEINFHRKKLDGKYITEGVIGKSAVMQKIIEQVNIVAPSSLSVLLEGESGTGKEVIACLIHNLSERNEHNFIAVDCGAIPESLIESELFGHEKGAFTDAKTSKEGKFELADKGTIFLDEITNLSDSNQIKLLRVIQERKVTRLGAKKSIKLDIRIISATNIKLADAVNSNNFRQDLYYRLNEFHLELPPLRERKEDISLFVEHFIKDSNEELNKNVKGVSESVMDKLMSHSWQGNVRELRNVIRRSVLLSREDIINNIDIPDEIRFDKTENTSSASSISDIKDELEKDMIIKALKDTNGNKSKAAKLLNMNERTFYRKIKNLGIS